ncbi:MAG: hypothetical protein WCE44_00570 [Candidatus Velthaea sp.]
MPNLELSDIRGIKSLSDAIALAYSLGYASEPANLDLQDLGIPGFTHHAFLRSGKTKRQGYGVLVGEMAEIPRSLTGLGRALRTLHDHPLAIVGVSDSRGQWNRIFVVRPRLIKSGNGFAYRTGRMEVDVTAPTRHDAEVLSQLSWDPAARDPQIAVDNAFDVEAVTKRFFTGLRRHFDDIERSIVARTKADTGVFVGVGVAGGARRVAIRLISQVLFCFFLQRKGLLANDAHYLVSIWNKSRIAKRKFHDALEDLFYETLSKPEGSRNKDVAHAGIPFLNGGLFERAYGDVRLGLTDDLFDLDEGLLGFLTRWTFTLHEETPDETDVAIDPELLGRVFEHLVSDEEQAKHGVVYTPRPVVQFMCREALIAWLQGQRPGLSEAHARRLLSDNDGLNGLRDEVGAEEAANAALMLEDAIALVTILDPAVGSGAFLLGMLAEMIRLRQLVHVQIHQRPASPAEIHAWKLHAIENCLFGVDIEPLALELCRLRLWLSLIVEIDVGGTVRPLPNLEYRTVAGNSLTDFVGGIEVQSVRREGGSQQPMDFAELAGITKLRDEFFATTDPAAKASLRKAIDEQELRLVERVLSLAGGRDQDSAKKSFLESLRRGFASRDRVFPIFMPAFHFPETYGSGGWDIVIENPPYLGRKEVAKRLPASIQDDYKQHFGETNDLLVLFGIRMFDFVRPGGVGAMIGNDSFLTSTDAVSLRQVIVKNATVKAFARTNCFEGQAVNGAVVVWRQGKVAAQESFHWVEAYKRDLRDFAGASLNVVAPGKIVAVGEMEVIGARNADLAVLPSRVFFRPSAEALDCLRHYREIVPDRFRTLEGWELLAKTPRLKNTIDDYRATGFFDRLRPGQFVPLGICIEGGPGLQTGDDRRFLAAVEDTDEGARCVREREALLARIADHPAASRKLGRDINAGMSEDDALLALAEDEKIEKGLRFPRLLRVTSRVSVFDGQLTKGMIKLGLTGRSHFVPFEKGDRSGEDETGSSMASRWTRENPIVIDWSKSAVALLRERSASHESHRRPRFQNEALCGRSGVSWNRIARYLRARLVPANAIFGDKTPVIVSTAAWLDQYALLALLNSDSVEFILKTFLGSLMQIEIGDLRRIPVPVLSPDQSRKLSSFGKEAVKLASRDAAPELSALESDLNLFVRSLYGIPASAQLWVTR